MCGLRSTAAVRTLVALTVTLAITAGAIEVMLRALRHHNAFLKTVLYSPADPVPYDGLDSIDALLAVTPFHPQPYAIWFGYKLNSHGFRTAEYARSKPPGTYRVLALGDSFASDSGGVPVDQLWPTLVGNRLRERNGRPTEVINLGVPGVGPRFTLRLFELEGRQLGPDLVLLGLFVGNDLTDERPRSTLAARLEQHSLLWRFLKHLIVLARNAPELIEERRRLRTGASGAARTGSGGFPLPDYHYDPDAPLVSPEEFVRIEVDRSQIFAVDMRPQVEQWIADVARTVTDLDRAVRAAGGALLVLIIPDVVQVDEALRQTVMTRSAPAGEDYDFDWVQPVLVRHFSDAGVTSLDLLPAFRAAPTAPRLYRARETHWSAAGNALAAEQAAAFLAARP